MAARLNRTRMRRGLPAVAGDAWREIVEVAKLTARLRHSPSIELVAVRVSSLAAVRMKLGMGCVLLSLAHAAALQLSPADAGALEVNKVMRALAGHAQTQPGKALCAQLPMTANVAECRSSYAAVARPSE